MGDLISVCLKHYQLPPQTSQEHNDYCFPLILMLINKLATHCEGPLPSILVQPMQRQAKRKKRPGDNPPQVFGLTGNYMIAG